MPQFCPLFGAVLVICVLLTLFGLSAARLYSYWKPESAPPMNLQPSPTSPPPPKTQPPPTLTTQQYEARQMRLPPVEDTVPVPNDCNIGSSYSAANGWRPNCFWRECEGYCSDIGCRGKDCWYMDYVYNNNYKPRTKEKEARCVLAHLQERVSLHMILHGEQHS